MEGNGQYNSVNVIEEKMKKCYVFDEIDDDLGCMYWNVYSYISHDMAVSFGEV